MSRRQLRYLLSVVILGLVSATGATAETAQPHEPLATSAVTDELRDEQRLPERFSSQVAGGGAPTVRFRMPLLSTDWWATTAYKDLNDAVGTLDYDCQAHTYDGHTGNDFAVRDFVDQDEGRFVVAAAPGVVVSTRDGEFDRHTDIDPAALANQIIVEHADGTLSAYSHLRKWSVLVAVGQAVMEGQPLAQVGSSGITNGPHLHFEVGFDGQLVEPHSGDCNGGSLWQNQQPHVLVNPITAFLTGISAEDPWVDDAYLFRPPDVLHVKQLASGTQTYLWVRLRYAQVGDEVRMTYLDPNSVVYDDRTEILSSSSGMTRYRWVTVLPGSGSLGTWTVELRVNGGLVETRTFVYDAVDYQDPVAVGRTVPVLYGAAAGDLRGWDADGGIKEFHIVSPPANGTLALSGPRQSRFTYVPDSGFDGPDTFTFEAEDAHGQVSPAAMMRMDVSPVVANTLRLGGEDDHVVVPDNGSLNFTGEFTLESWVRRDVGSAGWQILVERRNLATVSGYSLGIRPDSTLQVQLATGAGAVNIDGTIPVPMNRWTHLAATWDGQTVRLFVDGAEDPSSVAFNGPIPYPATYDTWLGRSLTAGNSFRGQIDEIRVWSVARSAAELRQGTNCSFHGGSPPVTLRGWWRFEGNAQDSSSYGNNGTPVLPAHFRLDTGAFDACAALDTDFDSIPDDVDNCVHAPNLDQTDTDIDGLGDACDGCPSFFGPQQHDADRDGIADACDVCPFVGDTDQTDTDGDGSGDLCDPDPGNPAVGVPGAISSVVLDHDATTGETTVNWALDPLAVSYAVIRGTLDEVRARHYGSCISSDDPDDTDTTFVDTEAPPSGALSAYLVVGVGAGNARGRSNLDSFGRMRDQRAKDCE